MYYSKWTNNIELAGKLKKYKRKEKVEKSGITLIHDRSNIYIDDQEIHNLVIGTTGSGKTQSIILPLARTSILAEESFIINDIKGEIYNILSNMLHEANYNVIILDFNEAKKGNNWNPLSLAYNYFKDGELDKTVKELENIAYYIFNTPKTKGDFWTNSAIDYFTGLALYLFEHAKENEINLDSIFELGNNVDKNDIVKFSNKIENNSAMYYNIIGTLKAPAETRGGIISTFNQGLKKYVSRSNLSNMLSNSDFDLKDIENKKTAIFIISGANSDFDSIIPLFINQVINSINPNNKKRINILLDEFDSLLPIKDFYKLINYCRSISVRFTSVIRSYKDLENVYGKEDAEILKMCFGTHIYLLSNDLDTLQEISKMCGPKTKESPLISIEELKTLNVFEAIIIKIREFPIKTNLLPDYKMEWKYPENKTLLPDRIINNNKNIYKINLK